MKMAGLAASIALTVVFALSASALSRPPSLSLLADDGHTLTLGWAGVHGASEFRFYADSQRVSRSFATSRTTVRFRTGAGRYTVEILLTGGRRRSLTYTRTQASSPEVAVIEDAGSVTGSSLTDRVKGVSGAGRLVVRPRPGEQMTVVGDLSVDRPNVTIQGLTVTGLVSFETDADGGVLRDSRALGFNIFGADNVLIEDNALDGRGINNQNIIWDMPAGNTPDGWIIRSNVFRNYYIDDGSTHSEALYIGYSTNGLIEDNTFSNNGNTSHVFFTWFGNLAKPWLSYPRNMCMRDNTFNQTHGAYYDVMVRQPEIPSNANIKIESDASTPGDNRQFVGAC